MTARPLTPAAAARLLRQGRRKSKRTGVGLLPAKGVSVFDVAGGPDQGFDVQAAAAYLKRKRRRKGKTPEGSLLASVKAWLESHGAKVERCNAGDNYRQYKGRSFCIKGHSKGCADLIACVPDPQYGSIPLAVETKADGEWTAEQQAWAADWRRAGGVYILARSLADVERELPWLS